MITHGTDGSDGIESGIHLRWAFNYKMGFPSDGFRLYRRKSDLRNRICIDFDKITDNRLKLPFTYSPTIRHGLQPKLKIESTARSLVLENIVLPDLGRSRVAKIEATTEIKLSYETSQCEIECYVSRGTEFEVIAKSDQEKVAQHTVAGESEGLKSISISAYGANSFVFKGKDIRIRRICYWICEDEGANPWEGPINDKCGFGLPFKQTVRSKYVQEAFKDECDTDWAVAACRLGPKKICDFKGENFDDLKDVLSTMEDDGINVPVGWNTMVLVDESLPSPVEDPTSPNIQISPYDLLLMQSQNTDLARILGLYWVDMEVVDGEYYDYKIVADWVNKPRILWKLEHQVTFDNEDIGKTFFTMFHEGNVVFSMKKPIIISSFSAMAAVKRGLTSNDPDEEQITLFFSTPVKEVQIFLRQAGLESRLEAYSDISTEPLDQDTMTKQEGVLAVHGNDIRAIRLLGKGIVIHRVHYDFEYLPYGQQKFIVCGVRKSKPEPLKVPTNLVVTPLPGMTKTAEDGTIIDHRFRAGLRWNIDGLDTGLLSHAPVANHVRRKTPRGEIQLVTGNNPVSVIPVDPSVQEKLEDKRSRLKWRDEQPPDERQHFVDAVDEKGTYAYQVAAVDLFGRVSAFSEPKEVVLVPPLPTPPTDVYAKFLDYESYDPEDDSFSDPNLTKAEKDWLKAYRMSAIVVRWKWTQQLQLQALGATKFRIHFQKGWLNLLQATISNVQSMADGFRFNTDINRAVAPNSLKDEWIRQGQKSFIVNTNEAGPNPTITVYKLPYPLEGQPEQGKAFVLPVTKLVEDGGAAFDYRIPENWEATLRDMDIILSTQEEYEVYIPNPPFPDPLFKVGNDEIETEKTRYAQIGVSTLSEEGNGKVSPPSAIMTIYRKKPSKQELEDASALKATPANVYGKSSFPLRWSKPQEPRIKFYIYRAMDETLFNVDRQLRQSGARDSAFYDSFLNEYPITLSEEEKNKLKATNPDYSQFSNKLLKALANLLGNEAAFRKLNGKPIDPNDPAFQNRNTEIPAPGESPAPIDPNKLLFVDDTLDGRGNNRYFYRTRAIDEIGSLGPFSLSTLPVEIPQVTPPAPPAITEISGGDRQITIKWPPNREPGIVGYLVYRTDSEKLAQDMRRMKLIKNDPADTYSVNAVSGQEPQFVDRNVDAKKRYYYVVVSVQVLQENGGTFENRSKPSSVAAAEAFDGTPPTPPTNFVVTRSSRNLPDGTTEVGVLLTWDPPQESVEIQVQRRMMGELTWLRITDNWIPRGTTQYFDNTALAGRGYQYRLHERKPSGTTNVQYAMAEVLPW